MSDKKVQIGLNMDAETLEKLGGQALLTEEIRLKYVKKDTELTMANYRGVIRDCEMDIHIAAQAAKALSGLYSFLFFHRFGANTKAQYDADSYYHDRYAEDVGNLVENALAHVIKAQGELLKIVDDHLIEIRRQAQAGLDNYRDVARELGIEEETEEGEEE